MESESVAAALERQHQEIDIVIAEFAAGPAARDRDRRPLRTAIQALRRHIYIEEEFLFPPLRDSGLVAPIFVMLREHAQLWATLRMLERELDTDQDGAGVMLCHQLAVQLLHHNLKEEKIVYPQAEETLTAEATAQLHTMLASGELPAGWTCQKARR
jgi:regulator of cell morphogenesis and NO signaling